MPRRLILPALFVVACTSLQADVTMRMSLGMKVNMAVPGALPQLPFKDTVIRIKGDRSYAALGTFILVTDNSRGDVTLLDTEGQHYAILPLADYLAKASGAGGENMQNMPEQAKQLLANMKFEVESHDTGRTDRIQGVEAFEREIVVNVSIPLPAPIPGQEGGPQPSNLDMSMKFQVWKPKAAEFDRLALLRELATFADRNVGFNNPTSMMRQMFSAMPGMSDNAGKIADEMAKGGNVMLGVHMGMFMPGLAKMLEQARAKGGAVPDLPTGDKPLVEMNFDLSELTADAVPDAIFVVPGGYKEAPADDLLKGMLSALTGKH